MKKITAILIAMLFCLMFSVVSFADDIYIVDDGEEDFVPATTTTTAPAETTTKSSSDSLLGDLGSVEDLLGGFSGMLGDGLDSILSGFEDLGQLDGNLHSPATTTSSSELPTLNGGERPTQSQLAQELTTDIADSAQQHQEPTAATNENELTSVLVVNGSDDDDSVLSGSTLTLLIFVAAIVLLIIVGAIVLVMLTRKTEYNSAVMDKSTIPGIEKPRAMSQFDNDYIGEDGKDYGNITYWNDDSGDK